jgi:hypothetical protein
LRRRKAAPVPLDPDAHRQAEALGRRTTSSQGQRAPPRGRLTAARSPLGCSRTPAKGPAGAPSFIPCARRSTGSRGDLGFHSRSVAVGRRGKERRRWGKGRGEPQQRRCASAIAGGEQLLQPPPCACETDRERGRNGLGLGRNGAGASFVASDLPAQPSDQHPTPRDERRWRQQATGRNGLGRESERRLVTAA